MFDYEGSRAEFLKILADMGEEPAFIDRARAAESSLKALFEQCQSARLEALAWPRRHFHVLRLRCVGNWSHFTKLVADAQSESLFAALSDQLPASDGELSVWFMTDRSALRSFLESGRRFNVFWSSFLDSDLLDEVNRRRDEYNQFYPMEKACAFGSDSAIAGFKPLPLLTRSWLEPQFPLLHLPTLP